MIGILNIVLVCVSSEIYGEYHFYRNLGGVFYDYSGSGYHAINGREVLEDEHDVTMTDRGAYFDGVSSYITVHSDTWKHLVLPEDWSLATWIHPMETRVILSRFRVDVNPPELMARFQHVSGDDIVFDIHVCESGVCQLETQSTSNGYLILNEWYILFIRLYVQNASRIAVDYFSSGRNRHVFSHGTYYEDPAGSYVTYLGTDLNSFYKGFNYLARFKPGTIGRSYFFTTTGCVSGQCYYFDGSLDTVYCSCNYCTMLPSLACISDCIDINSSADCVACSACDGICSYGDSCVECPKTSWPSCDTDGTSFNSFLCDPECLSCTGPSNKDCINCIIIDAYVDSSTQLCRCPENSVATATECECNLGYFKTNGNCEACVYPCETCEDREQCLTCIEGVLTPNKECALCETGNYLSDSLICEPCPKDCINCVNPNQCSICKHLNQVPTDGSCVCIEGYFEIEEGCSECRSICKTCSSYEICLSCEPNAQFSENSCQCDHYYTETTEGCQDYSFVAYMAITPENSLYINFEANLLDYLESSDLTIQVENDPEFTWEINELNKNQAKIVLNFEEYIREGTNLDVYFNNMLISEDLGYLKTNQLNATLYEFIYEMDVMKNVGSALKAFTGASIMTSSFSSFSGLWSLLNTVQILMFIPLTNNPLTKRLYYFLKALSNYFPIPDLFDTFLSDHGSRPYELAYIYGFKTNDFLLNSAQFISMFILLLMSYIVLKFLGKCGLCKYECFGRFIQVFEYSLFIRFFLQSYLEIGFNSVLQILEPNQSSFQGWLNFVLSNVYLVIFMQVFLFVFPISIIICSVIYRDKITDLDNAEFHERWGSLYFEFKFEANYLKAHYYIVYLFCRLLFILNLVFMRYYPKIQALLNASFAFIVTFIQKCLYVVSFVPFSNRKIQFMNTVAEIIILAVFVLVNSFVFNLPDSSVIDLVIIYLIITLTTFITIMNLWMSIESLRLFCKLYRERKNKVSIESRIDSECNQTTVQVMKNNFIMIKS